MIQEFLYKQGFISRPFGSQLGEVEPTDAEKFAYRPLMLGTAELYPVIGGDFSRWQGKVDWGMTESQLYFAYIQSSYGAAGIDSGFRINLAGVQKRNMAYGLYHYLKPGNDFRKTAQLFYDCWKDSGSQLPPAFDIEQNDGKDKNDLNLWMEKVLKTFNDLAGGYVLKMGYSSASFINTYVMTTPTFDWVKNLDWWIANWTTGPAPILPTVFSKFARPKTWTFWQYTSKGDGPKYGTESPALDLNRFNGNLTKFNEEYKVDLEPRPITPPPPPPPPPPDNTPLGQMRVRTPNGIYVRSGPGQEFPVIGGLGYDSIITPSQVEGKDAWIEFEPGKWACVTLGGIRFLDKVS